MGEGSLVSDHTARGLDIVQLADALGLDRLSSAVTSGEATRPVSRERCGRDALAALC
jgi:hypothetical protein